MKKTAFITSLLLCLAFPCFKALALSTSLYARTSVLNQGKWVKVRVENTGMQEISFDDLRAAGFSDPSKVVVFGYGGIGDRYLTLNSANMQWLDDLRQIYSQPIAEQNKLVFFGEAGVKYEWSGVSTATHHENFDSDYGYYFLTDSYSRLNTPVSTFSPETRTNVVEGAARATAASYPRTWSPSNAGSHLFSENFLGKGLDDFSKKTVTLTLEDYLPESLVNLNLNLIAGGSGSPKINVESSDYSGSLTFSLSDYIDDKDVEVKFFATRQLSITNQPASRVGDNYAELDISFTPMESSLLTRAAYEYIIAGYRCRTLLSRQTSRVMQFSNVTSTSRILLEEPSESARVWAISARQDITPLEIYSDPSDGKRYFGTNANYTSPTDLMRVVLFDPARKLNKAEVLGEVAPQNIHGESVPGMIIVASPKVVEQAKRLAAAHDEFNGMKVLVVTPEQVYNEFSSGTPSVNAYRRMAKMFYDRDGSHNIFNYFMLFGMGIYDPRCRTAGFNGLDPMELVLTFPMHDISFQADERQSTSSDNFIAMLDDNLNYTSFVQCNVAKRIHLSVGRVPAPTETEAKIYVDKAIKYMNGEHPYSAFNRAILLSDDGNSDAFIQECEEIANIIKRYSPSTTINRIYNSIYPWKNNVAVEARKAMTAALKEGVSYMVYSGHGRPDGLTEQMLWNKTQIAETSYPYAPMMVLSTCDVFAFDRRDGNMCEDMLFKANGGVIGLIASGRTVYADKNKQLNLQLANEIYNPLTTSNRTYGYAFRKAVNDAYASGDQKTLINTLCYNFGGDPALPSYTLTRQSIAPA